MAKPLIPDALWAEIAPLLPPPRPRPKGNVRRVLQKPAAAGGHGMLVMFDVTDSDKVARHDREGWYERDC